MAHYQPPGQPQHQHQQQQQQQQRYREQLDEQISRHQDLERGLNRVDDRHSRSAGGLGPSLARVVEDECREAKIRKQNRQVLIFVGGAVGLIVLVIWFVNSR